ncbi:potassium transporter Trk [Halobacteriales archaeon QS_4_69_34]|nr:MAG: potassium transporter Trk [Halobacteriales archaeon QS_4_69_34]
MRCVIVGYGRVGIRTAQILGSEGHEVCVVDEDPRKVERAREAGFAVIEGDGARPGVLEAADLDTADALGGLTGDPDVNYEACAIGKEHGCRVVLRIEEDYEEETYQYYAGAVDEIIYPERLGAAGAKTALLGGDFNVLADLTEKLSAATIRIPEGSPAIGERVVGLDIPESTRIYAHGRANEPMEIPLPRTVVEAGDEIALIGDPGAVAAVRERLSGADAAA